MNSLHVGFDKSAIIQHLPDTFLIVDDGSLIDRIVFPKRRKITHLDLAKHSVNFLKGMDYSRARETLHILDAIFPEGENTLTKRSSNFVILTALLSGQTDLTSLIVPDKNEPGSLDAHQKIQTLLLSPVLNPFLTRPTRLSFSGIIVARLDRTALSDFDCFVIANILISRYQGHVVVPDFGFYGCPFHRKLIWDNRLTAGVNFLDEAKGLKNDLLSIQQKFAGRCTAQDAEVLAGYEGVPRGTNAYADFIQKSIA